MIWRIAPHFDRPARLLLLVLFAAIVAGGLIRANVCATARVLRELDQ